MNFNAYLMIEEMIFRVYYPPITHIHWALEIKELLCFIVLGKFQDEILILYGLHFVLLGFVSRSFVLVWNPSLSLFKKNVIMESGFFLP